MHTIPGRYSYSSGRTSPWFRSFRNPTSSLNQGKLELDAPSVEATDMVSRDNLVMPRPKDKPVLPTASLAAPPFATRFHEIFSYARPPLAFPVFKLFQLSISAIPIDVAIDVDFEPGRGASLQPYWLLLVSQLTRTIVGCRVVFSTRDIILSEQHLPFAMTYHFPWLATTHWPLQIYQPAVRISAGTSGRADYKNSGAMGKRVQYSRQAPNMCLPLKFMDD